MDALAAQYGEELSEGLVNISTVYLIDDKPPSGLKRLGDQAGHEIQRSWARNRIRHVSTYCIKRSPIGCRGREHVMVFRFLNQLSAQILGEFCFPCPWRAIENQMLSGAKNRGC